MPPEGGLVQFARQPGIGHHRFGVGDHVVGHAVGRLAHGDALRADFGSHSRSRVVAIELLNAKRRYGVSMAVALRRLKDLDLITVVDTPEEAVDVVIASGVR